MRNTIGFSVPINQAKQILPQLKADGRVTRGWLGVQIQEVTEQIAEQFGLDEAQRRARLPDPARDAGGEVGIQRGDVIVEFDGKTIDEWRDLPIVVAQAAVEQDAKVVVDPRREAQGYARQDRPPARRRAARVERDRQQEGAGAFGLRLQDLTPALAEQLGIEEVEGVLVADVDPAGPAAESGIRRGDLIVEVDRAPVKNAEALASKLGATKKSALLLVRRGDNTLYVALERAKS